MYYLRIGGSVKGPASREKIQSLWDAGKIPAGTRISEDRTSWQPIEEFMEGAEEPSKILTEKRADGPPGKKKKKQSKRGKGKGLYPHWMIPSFLDNSAIAAPLTLQEAIDLRDGVGFLRIALICVVTIFGAFIAPIFFVLYMLKFIKVRLYKPMILTHGICLAISLIGGCCIFPALFFITSDDNPRDASILPLVIQIASTLFGFVLSMAYVYFISGYLHGLSNNVSCPKGAKKFAESFIRFCFALAIPVIYIVLYTIMFVIMNIIAPGYEMSKPYFLIISLSGICLLIFIYFLISIINFFSGLSLLSSNLDDYIDECPEPEDDLGSETV